MKPGLITLILTFLLNIHPPDLNPRQGIYLNIDLAQMGVGGENSCGALPHDKFRFFSKKIFIQFLYVSC